MILKALYDYYNRCGDDIVPMDMVSMGPATSCGKKLTKAKNAIGS